MAGVVRVIASSVFHGIFGALNNKHRDAETPALLHGVLEVTVYEANHLHNVIEGLLLQAAESVQEAFKDKLAHTRLFAAVEIGAATVVRTRMAEFQPDNPKWNQSFRVYCAYTSPYVEISVRNRLQVSLAMAVGRAKISSTTHRGTSGRLVRSLPRRWPQDAQRAGPCRPQVHPPSPAIHVGTRGSRAASVDSPTPSSP
ncbi:hypothetical protein OPV22_023641 [Ensete ventricosum]|uniref:C2 domain-containing protein n=1 Tax=Ensete ventricosum TaxID=4639 RepID=A0AAV8QII0_ENSVE|nr:hypothetical protein OPV22_023641 [Ensete ventricosum]